MQIPFCGATYQGRSTNVDASRSVNLFPELTGTQDNKSQMIMVGTPGLYEFTVGTGGSVLPVRELHTCNNRLYAVIDNTFCFISYLGVVTSLGTLDTSTGRVLIVNNGYGTYGNQILIVDGTSGYIYNQSTLAFAEITSAGGWTAVLADGGPQYAEFLDGYFIVRGTGVTYWVSDLYNGLIWNALATARIMATPDPIQAIVNHRQQLFFIKKDSTEVSSNTGTPTTSGSPFDRVGGAVYDYGTPAPWSIAKGGASFYFICNQRTDDGGEVMGVAEVTEYSPVMISTPAISYKVTRSTTLTNCFGYCYAEQGHMFYVLTNPDDDWTVVYDAVTKMWHERSSLGTNLVTKRHLGNCYTYYNGKHYVGDYRNSGIYEMHSDYTNDNGVPIVSFRTSQTVQDPDKRNEVHITRLWVDVETGVGQAIPDIVSVTSYPAGYNGTLFVNVDVYADGTITAGAVAQGIVDPQAYLSWSNDSGHTWSADYPASMGQQGEYSKQMKWRRLGRAKDRIFKLTMPDACKKIIIGANIEASA